MATIEQLKEQATSLGLDFKAKATKSELERLIADATWTPEKVESIEDTNEDAKNEALEVPKENEQPEDEAPKLNKDGFVGGQILTEKELAEYMAKQRARK